LAAKILLRLRRNDPAVGAIANAIGVHPTFALRALHDADFAKAGPILETVAKTERLRLKQRAQDRVKTAVERAIQLGVLEPGKSMVSDLPASFGACCPSAMLEATTDLIGRDTLFGYLEAEVLATQLIDSLASLLARCDTDKRALSQAVGQAHKTIAEVADLKWRSHRGAAESAKKLGQAREMLAEVGETACPGALRDFLINGERAKLLLAAACDLIEACKRAALEEASAKRNELDAQISRSSAIEESWARCIRRGAFFGLLVAGVITLYTEILSGGAGIGRGELPALTRLAMLTLASVFVGAVGGAITAPIVNSGAQSHLQKAESAKHEVDEAIRRLMAEPLTQFASVSHPSAEPGLVLTR